MTNTVTAQELIVPTFGIKELTTDVLNGSGVLDVLLNIHKTHLLKEFDDGRITGHEYSSAYVEGYGVTLTAATAYAIARIKMPYELYALEIANKLADSQLERLRLEIENYPLEVELKNKQIALAERQIELAEKDIELKIKLLEKVPYEIDLLIKQGEQMEKQTLAIQADTAIKEYQLNTVMPAEVDGQLAQTNRVEMETLTVRKQTELVANQIVDTQMRTNQVKAETGLKLPAEVSAITTQTSLVSKQILQTEHQTINIDADTAIKEYQRNIVMPKEVDNLTLTGLGITADTNIKVFQLSTQLPAEVNAITAQTALVGKQVLQTVQQTDNLISQKAQIEHQTSNIDADTSIKEYQLNTVMPKEVDNLVRTGLAITADTDIKTFQLSTQLPAEVESVKAQTTNTAATTTHTLKQNRLVEAQTCQVGMQTSVIQAELATKLPEEVKLLKKQTIQSDAQGALLFSQRESVIADRTLKLPAEINMIEAQITKLGKDIELSEAQLDIAGKELVLKDKEIQVQGAQASLYEQKKVTEQAQTNGSVIGVDSVIARQNELMKAQTDGFQRDAEQKAAKILIDTWALRKNTDPDDPGVVVDNVNKLQNSTIGLALQAMLAGINVNV